MALSGMAVKKENVANLLLLKNITPAEVKFFLKLCPVGAKRVRLCPVGNERVRKGAMFATTILKIILSSELVYMF